MCVCCAEACCCGLAACCCDVVGVSGVVCLLAIGESAGVLFVWFSCSSFIFESFVNFSANFSISYNNSQLFKMFIV